MSKDNTPLLLQAIRKATTSGFLILVRVIDTGHIAYCGKDADEAWREIGSFNEPGAGEGFTPIEVLFCLADTNIKITNASMLTATDDDRRADA